ncbi:Xaa-Pro peptidase family protein [Tistrella mobilis]|uniref:M24 family metallopeptidase n=1 Tax=Tistrella mobilis TaxID=171437 RepID=UPI003556DE9E
MTTELLPAAITGAPPLSEITDRVDRLRAAMDLAGIDALILTNPDSVYYLTHFANFVHERPFILLVTGHGPLRFVVPALEIPHVRIRGLGAIDCIAYREFPAPAGQGWDDRLAGLLTPGLKVAVEPDCPLFVAARLAAAGHDPAPSALVEDLRMVKSAWEIGRLRHAADLVSDAHAALLAMARPGLAAIEIHGVLSRRMTGAALAANPHLNLLACNFAAVAQPPEVSHDPHNFTDLFMALGRGGPHVSVIACRADGYAAELERTFFLGEVPEAARPAFGAMAEARALAFDLLKPGASMAAIDVAVNASLIRAGHGDHLLHRTGHAFGVTGHEAPFLAEGYERIVEAGQVFSIEPGLYIEGLGGFRHSDTVLVTETGCLSLTSAPDRLEDLVVSV